MSVVRRQTRPFVCLAKTRATTAGVYFPVLVASCHVRETEFGGKGLRATHDRYPPAEQGMRPRSQTRRREEPKERNIPMACCVQCVQGPFWRVFSLPHSHTPLAWRGGDCREIAWRNGTSRTAAPEYPQRCSTGYLANQQAGVDGRSSGPWGTNFAGFFTAIAQLAGDRRFPCLT